MSAHTTADDPTKYRLSAEEDAWKDKDPLKRLELYLRSSNTADESFFEEVAVQGDEMAAKVRAEVLAMTGPEMVQSFNNVYADPHPLVAEELAWHREYEAGFADSDEAGESN
jgi:pyruvate dehydrogenase E1 component alpha subunit